MTTETATAKMDTELKAKWVEALRSGKYTQGRGALRRNDNTYCCLGVLADIIDHDGWSSSAYDHGVYSWVYEGCEDTACLSNNLERSLNISAESGTLMDMNDRTKNRVSFSEIADYIEQNL
jgi:hypothetical protein